MPGPQCSLTPVKERTPVEKRTLQLEIKSETSFSFWRSGQDDWPATKSPVVTIQDFDITT